MEAATGVEISIVETPGSFFHHLTPLRREIADHNFAPVGNRRTWPPCSRIGGIQKYVNRFEEEIIEANVPLLTSSIHSYIRIDPCHR